MSVVEYKSKMFKRFVLTWALGLPILFYALFMGGKEWLSANLFETSRQTLSLYVSGLSELLNKYHPLPEIYAQHPVIKGLLKAPGDEALQQQANLLLARFNKASEASDTYILDRNGLTLAASNWNQATTFVGRSFGFRPYFQDAMATGRGQFFALGTASLRRGYYLAHAVKDVDGRAIGVVVVKVNVAKVEKGWQAPSHDVIVTDQAGIVFLSSRPEWLYKALGAPPSEALAELGRTRRYANKIIGRLPFKIEPEKQPWSHSFKFDSGLGTRYLATYQDIKSADWRVWILADSSPMRNTALAYALAIVLIITMAAVAGVSLVERRRGLLRALEVQRQARETLENSSLELEHQVEKRTKDLKQAHNELVQAGKMAALGQMSVGINHELNQPLTAIRSYADNADKFLQQGRIDEARENLTLISSLSERMGDIILRLKIFARESSDERTPQNLGAVINDTMRIVSPRLKKDRVELAIDMPAHDIFVLVNDVRLEQVLVNLINNAIDALENDGDRRIELSAKTNNQDVIVHVRDFGPGIPDNVIHHLFEPFFTTKKIGIGLGLGLSISYGIIQDFGGELKAQNLPQGGALFSFNIPLIDALQRPDTDAG